MNVYNPQITAEQMQDSEVLKKAAEVFKLGKPQFEMAEIVTWSKGLDANFRKKVIWACWTQLTLEERNAFLDKQAGMRVGQPIDPLEYAVSDLDRMIDWAKGSGLHGPLLGLRRSKIASEKKKIGWVLGQKQRDLILSAHGEYRARDPEEPDEMELVE